MLLESFRVILVCLTPQESRNVQAVVFVLGQRRPVSRLDGGEPRALRFRVCSRRGGSRSLLPWLGRFVIDQQAGHAPEQPTMAASLVA